MTSSPETPQLVLFDKILPDGSIKRRQLWKPDPETYAHHKEALWQLRMLEIDMPLATGSIRGKGILDNVAPHRYNDYFYMVDIEDAFPSVDKDYLKELLGLLSPPEQQKYFTEFIDDYATMPGVDGLPLGLPCSPYLFNIYCSMTDWELLGYCERSGITATRYLDDFTFSSQEPINRIQRKDLREIIESTPGFAINPHKTRRHSIATAPVTVTGMSIHQGGDMQIAPHLVRKAKEVFKDIIRKQKIGDTLTEKEIGQLHGWHGVLESMKDPGSPEPETHRWLDAYYRRALGKLTLPRVTPATSSQITDLPQVEQYVVSITLLYYPYA